MLLAYIGPDTMLPLTSVIAACVAGVLMFGRLIRLHVVGLARMVMRRSQTSVSSTPGAIRRSAATIRRDDAQIAPEGPHPEPSHAHSQTAQERAT